MSGVLIFIAVLSVLVFIHELGHFVAAKACGIYVHQFSVGMPPRIFGFKWGETDYCIGALPIGGFVHMAGQEDAPLSEEEREEKFGDVPPDRWFNNKPVWQRYIVVLAGPLMNLFLAIVIYSIIAAMGPSVPEWELSARAGAISPDSAASSAPLFIERAGATASDYSGEPDAIGWQTGDTIVTIDGNPAQKIMDLAIAAILGGESAKHHVILERMNTDGGTTRYASIISPSLLEGEERPRFGVGEFATPLVGSVIEGMPGMAAGLQEEDIILRADGELVSRDTFIKKVEGIEPGDAIELTVLRAEEAIAVSLVPATIGRMRGLVTGPFVNAETGEHGDEQPVVLVDPSGTMAETGIQRKDIIIEINGKPATAALLKELEESSPGGTLSLKIQRPSILFGLIQQGEQITLEVPVDSVRAIGVGLQTRMVIKEVAASQVIPEGLRESYKALALTLQTIKGLVQGKVSPKDLGGPVMIARVTVQAADMGMFWLLNIMAFISVNLCVFNLLPLPVLDGGLLVIHGLEAIRRRPLSVKVQERYQQFGLVLILGLMLFVTFNDVSRWVKDSLIP